MRATHRSVSIELILQEAIRNGVLAEDDVSKTTLTRLYARHGLARLPNNRVTSLCGRAGARERAGDALEPGPGVAQDWSSPSSDPLPLEARARSSRSPMFTVGGPDGERRAPARTAAAHHYTRV